jgi:hypothetical protein
MAPFIATYDITVTHDVQMTRKEAEVSHAKFRNIPENPKSPSDNISRFLPDIRTRDQTNTKHES